MFQIVSFFCIIGIASAGYLGGLGYSGLGYSGVGYSGLGYSGLGYSGLGYSGLGYSGYGVGVAPVVAAPVVAAPVVAKAVVPAVSYAPAISTVSRYQVHSPVVRSYVAPVSYGGVYGGYGGYGYGRKYVW